MKKLVFVSTVIIAFAALVAIGSASASQESTKAYMGEVASVDADAGEVLIKESNGNEVRLLVNSDTRITRGEEEIGLTDLKPGEKVTARCQESDSGCVALSINAGPPEPDL